MSKNTYRSVVVGPRNGPVVLAVEDKGVEDWS